MGVWCPGPCGRSVALGSGEWPWDVWRRMGPESGVQGVTPGEHTHRWSLLDPSTGREAPPGVPLRHTCPGGWDCPAPLLTPGSAAFPRDMSQPLTTMGA